MSRDALVVGINFYERLNKLKSPSEDAEAIAQRLTEFGGFRVRRLPGVKDKQNQDNDLGRVGRTSPVSLTQLEEALVQLFKPRGENIPETALLFFSGHGLRKEQGIQEGFLATSDVNPQQGNWGVRLKWLRELLAESPVRRQIIWLDCCHSGELLNFAETLREAAPGNQENRHRCFITACRAFEVAREQASGSHGVLTSALLRGLDPTQQPDGWVTNYSLADFINRELEIQTQRPLCQNSGKAIVLTNNQPKKRLGECPYKGLESFNLKDAHFFYGRTALTDELIKRVEKSNFVAVLGASGSGKSSVLSAGLLYKLKRGEDLLGSDRWQFYPPFNPGEHPLQNLKAAIGKEPDKLEELIATAQAERVVLIVDQFEECFTLCKDEECQRFLDCLLGAVERTGNKLCLVLGMRADFLDKCTQYPKLADKIESENLAIVKPLDREELREAITKPAETVGLQVEPRLVVKMIEDVVSSPGRLPLLQDALRELWNEAQKSPDKHLLTLDSYEALGGIEKTLEKRANKTYDEELKTDAERLVAERVFLELTYVGEETEVKVTLKPVHKERLVENVSFGESKEVVNRAIAVLEKARLIFTSDAGVVSIAHQALISNWERLRHWVEENPEARRKKQKIEAAAEEWQAKRKSKGYLLQGERLVEAEGFVQSYADTVPLSSLGQEFVKASREESDRLQAERDRRRRRTILGLAGFSVVALILAGAAGWQWQRAELQVLDFQLNALSASSEELYNSYRDFDALIEGLRAGVQLKRSILGRWVKADTQLRVMTTLMRSFDVREHSRLEGHSDQVQMVRFSPDGKTLASASWDNTVRLWSIDGTLLKILKGHSNTVYSVSFSPDGKTLASASGDNTVKLWSVDGTLLKTLEGNRQVFNSVSFSPDGQILATAASNGIVKLWSRDGRELKTLDHKFKYTDLLLSVSFSPDSRTIASTSWDGKVRIWSINGTLLKTLKGHSKQVYSVSFSPDGQLIATASADKTVKLWKPDGTLLKTMKRELRDEASDVVNEVTFSPDGKMIVSAGDDRTIKFWSRDGEFLKAFRDDAFVKSVSFSPDGKLLASANHMGTVKLWKINFTARQPQEPRQNLSVNDVSFSPDSQKIAVAIGDGTVQLLNRDRTLLKTFRGHKAAVHSVRFSPNGQMIASASKDGTVKLWSLDGRELKTLQGHMRSVNDVSFSPDGQMIASASGDSTVKLWSRDGTLLKTLNGHSDDVLSVSFSPDGKMIASASFDRTVKLWSLDGRELKTLQGHTAPVENVNFSPDGKLIASASDDQTVKLWSRDGILLKNLLGHENAVTSVSFSPDGKILGSADYTGTVKFWNLDSYSIRTLESITPGRHNKVRFSPDGKMLAKTGEMGEAYLVSLDLDDQLVRGCDWVRDYLKTNPNVSESDKHLCDGVGKSNSERHR